MISDVLFSVLIANYNNGKYIDEAIESVFLQTYENWEIIIVDDSSSDNSLQVLKRYESDGRIKVYQNDRNHGCGYTKRRCAELANGAIFGFLDPDDILTTNALEIMVNAHIRNLECSMIYSKLIICDEKLVIDHISTYQAQVPKETSFLKMSSGRVSQFATMKMSNYKRTVGIDPKFKRAVDQDLYYKMEEVGELLFVDEPLYYYRINTGGISSNGNYNKAFAWSLVARIDACNRRGIDIEDVLPNVIESEKAIRAFYENSSDYKFGAMLLKPYRWLKSKYKRIIAP